MAADCTGDHEPAAMEFGTALPEISALPARLSGFLAALAERRREGAFSPECLTLYMNNECNLSCVYCHSDPSPGPASRLDEETIVAAAEVVAENCKQKGRPFYLVFHGGGEPTLHRERVELGPLVSEVVSEIEVARADRGVALERRRLPLPPARARRLSISSR